MTSCLHLLEEHQQQQQQSMEFQNFLGQSICGFDGSSFLVKEERERDSIWIVALCCHPLQVCCAQQHGPLISRSPKDYAIVPSSASPSGGQLLFAPLGAGSTSTQQSPIVVFQPTPPLNQAQLAQQPPSVVPSPAQPSQLAGCGISAATSNRVVGGLPARKGKPSFRPLQVPLPSSPPLAAGAYPWMAALGYYDEFNRNALKFLCAGSLISSHYVITSAHCINPTLTLVRLGAQDLSRTAEPGAMDFRIRRSIVNEHFDLASIANDIALIELSGEAPSSGEWR